jgi:hypothetical protein
MAARRILKLAILILLLVWEPGPSPQRAPHPSPEGGGASLDVGFRIDPGRPWTSWRFYVELRPAAAVAQAEREEGGAEASSRTVEVGPASLARAAGGASFILLRGGIESLLRRGGAGERR